MKAKEVIKMSITDKLGKMGIPGFRSGKKWKMVIASIGYFLILMIILGAMTGPGPSQTSTNPVPEQKISTPVPTIQSKSIEEIKKDAITIPYKDLMRESENYIGKIVYYRGQIKQVQETSGNKYIFRIATKKSDYGDDYNDDVIWVEYKGSRMLENDIVDIWGEVKGLQSYEAVLGNKITIPSISSLYLIIAPEEPAKVSYIKKGYSSSAEQWDSDPELDGIKISLEVYDDKDKKAKAKGILEAVLYERVYDDNSQATKADELDRWSVQVTKDDYDDSGYLSKKLEYNNAIPKSAEYGWIEFTFTTEDGSKFQTYDDFVSLRK